MLKKLGSDLLYLVLKSADRFNDCNLEGYVISPIYLPVVIECVEDASAEDLIAITREINIEFTRGDYLDNPDFLDNLGSYFDLADGVCNPREWKLYKIIKDTFNTLKAESIKK